MNNEERDEILKRIERALLGDKAMGHRGLVERIEELEEKAEEVETFKKKVSGGVIVLSLVGSMAVTIGTWLINKLWA